MTGEHDAQAQEPSAEPAEPRSRSYDRWMELGRSALQPVRRPAAVELGEVIEECVTLIIYEHWIANGRSCTKTAEILGIGRKRVAKAMKPWRQAQHDEGGEHR